MLNEDQGRNKGGIQDASLLGTATSASGTWPGVETSFFSSSAQHGQDYIQNYRIEVK